MNRDIRFAIRMLVRQRVVTLIAIITLAIGIGAVTSVFSIVNSVLIKPLAYRDPDKLVLIWGNFLALGLERLPAQPVSRVMKLEDIIAASLDTRRLVMFLLGIFSSAALFLAATGIYGSMTYAAKRRSREIGIRIALGAGSNDVILMIVREGMIITLTGIFPGAILAVPTGQAISGLLFEIGPVDPVTMILAASLFLSVAAVATYLPARRAAAADPMAVLRHY